MRRVPCVNVPVILVGANRFSIGKLGALMPADSQSKKYLYEIGQLRRRPTMLGDKLERVFRLMGVKRAAKLYEAKTGRSCGCDKRKQALNQMF